MKKEIIEGNKLIATFMNHGGGEQDIHKNPVAEYHTSWSWLMPVVEKIEHCDDAKNSRNYSFHVCIFDKDCHIFEYMNDTDEPPLFCEEGETKIEATWRAVVAFIGFYNTQNK